MPFVGHPSSLRLGFQAFQSTTCYAHRHTKGRSIGPFRHLPRVTSISQHWRSSIDSTSPNNLYH